tara:strand:+ start:652 stop:810 length:159 start_codon:yes stop_codon:yes gene_type:complete
MENGLRKAIEELIEVGAIELEPTFETLKWVCTLAKDTDGSQTAIYFAVIAEL